MFWPRICSFIECIGQILAKIRWKNGAHVVL